MRASVERRCFPTSPRWEQTLCRLRALRITLVLSFPLSGARDAVRLHRLCRVERVASRCERPVQEETLRPPR